MSYINEIEAKILELYHLGMNTVQIGEVVGKYSGTVGRVLKKHNLKPLANKLYFPKEEIEYMVKQYNNGVTSIELGKQYGITDRTVANLLRKEGVEIRKGGHQSKLLNHNYFNVIDTPEKAYWLGFILTDGSITLDKRGNRSHSFGIMLRADDAYLLKEFDKQLGSDGSSVKFTNRNTCYLRYSSQQICDALLKYGIANNITFTVELELPQLQDELMPHLIRGIFDGDGTIYFRENEHKNGSKIHLRFGFYGTQKLCIQLVAYLHAKIGLPVNKITNKGTVSFITFQRITDVINFYHYIYNRATVCLSRKRNKFEQFLQIPR